jgi:hypothetical protein
MAKLGLCVGINAYGHGSDLAGCVNDATDWGTTLHGRGFDEVSVVLDEAATRANLLAQMRALTERLRRGDVGVITYSGHGTWVPDLDGDEADKRDEAICPVDLWDAGPITDDELFSVFGSRRFGAKLIFIADSCFSGTVSRLADLRPRPQGMRPPRVRFLPPGAFLDGSALRRAEAIRESRDNRPRTSALTLSGCRDDQVSYDAWFQTDGRWRANGAFTQAALAALAGLKPKATYRNWYRAIVPARLPTADYDQVPQLQGSCTQVRWRAF